MADVKAFVVVFGCLLFPAVGWTADFNVLDKSRELMAGTSYYEAVVVMEPLLLQKEKSDAQQESYVIAENALKKLVLEEFILMREYETLYPIGSGSGPGDMEWEKIKMLNRLGAGITYDRLGGAYDYHHDFLRALVKRYPDSRYAPAARFYNIRPGINEIKEVERELRELSAYINKYPDLKESELARLKIARINDNLWESLDQNGWPPFSSGDADKDKERAARSRRTALRLYEKLFKSDKLDAATTKEINERYKALKAFKNSGRYYIISD